MQVDADNRMKLSLYAPLCGGFGVDMQVSPVFAKKMTLARHRIVNKALKEEIARLHAFTQKPYTPEEWEGQQAKTAINNDSISDSQEKLGE
jgi:hypothetical protein